MSDDSATQAPVTDDQELAKVLASMSDESKTEAAAPAPQAAQAAPAEEDIPPIPATLPSIDTSHAAPAPTPDATFAGPSPAAMPAPSGGLEGIKQQALQELRPLVGKLELPAEEKFDALLLVIRSSDDQSLIQAAYQAAEGITDEAKKAQALLDIVKEIEYFSSQKPAA